VLLLVFRFESFILDEGQKKVEEALETRKLSHLSMHELLFKKPRRKTIRPGQPWKSPKII
jgi:hypothetical protein